MSKKRKHQNDTANDVNNEITNTEETGDMKEKKSLGTKFGEGLKKVKEAKATKVVVGVVAAAAVGAAAYIAGKKDIFKKDSDEDLDYYDADLDEDVTSEETVSESEEN